MRWLTLALMLFGCQCAHSPPCLSDTQRTSTGWAEAEALFRGDPSWRGGDMASSVDLGAGRVLWLFGDSFVSANGSRSRAPFAHNSIAIQHGYDPAHATVDFHYQRDAQGAPSAFFAADAPDTELWFGDGARLGDVLFLFLTRIKNTGDGTFGFAADIAEARLVMNPDDDPSAWKAVAVAVPANPWNVMLSEGAVLVDGGYLYAFACADPGNHDMFLVRWPVDTVKQGKLDDPEWATGTGAWTAQSKMSAPPMRVFAGGHTEMSVFFDSARSRYVQVQATGFPGDLMLRTAPALTGPWSEARAIYHPPEADCTDVITYAGKAHPELQAGGKLALTYASNHVNDFAAVVNDQNLYFPRFVRMDLTDDSVSR
jgi:hypothetical protein